MRGKRAKQLRKLAQAETTIPKLNQIHSEHLCATTTDGWERVDKIHRNTLVKIKEFFGKKFDLQHKISTTFKWSGPKRKYRDLKKAYVRG